MKEIFFNLRHIEPNTEYHKMLLSGREGCVLYEGNLNGLTINDFDNAMQNLKNKIGGFEVVEITYGEDINTFLIVFKPIEPKITDV